jgi:hypothetical protein
MEPGIQCLVSNYSPGNGVKNKNDSNKQNKGNENKISGVSTRETVRVNQG